MANVWNGYAKTYTGEIDKNIVQGSKTGMFADNDFGAKFVGTKEVIIPELEMTGLGNYVRIGNGHENEGYPQGRTVVDYVSYSLNRERARKLPFDASDADESGVTNLMGKITGEYTRNHIIPEVDAYNLSTLFGIAKENNAEKQTIQVDTATSTTTQNKAVSAFVDMITDVEESVAFGDDELIAFIDKTMWNLLMNSDKFTRQIIVSDFKQGGIDMRVREFNGVKLIRVDANRMKTAYDYKDGTNVNEGGFTVQEGASSIRSLILPKKCASFIKKIDDIKIFSPEENQNGNGYIIDFHMYYDLLVKKSRKGNIFALYE